MKIPRFGLNRFDSRSVDAFAADVRRAETLGWDAALEPDSQLRRPDTYVFLAAAARATERITLGPLLANLVNRHPTVTASYLSLHTPDALLRIQTGDPSWEQMVPPVVAEMIKTKKLFGHRTIDDLKDVAR